MASTANTGEQGSGMIQVGSRMDSKESVLFSSRLHSHFQALSLWVSLLPKQRTPPKLFQVPSNKYLTNYIISPYALHPLLQADDSRFYVIGFSSWDCSLGEKKHRLSLLTLLTSAAPRTSVSSEPTHSSTLPQARSLLQRKMPVLTAMTTS
jgi:hypothetical protein